MTKQGSNSVTYTCLFSLISLQYQFDVTVNQNTSLCVCLCLCLSVCFSRSLSVHHLTIFLFCSPHLWWFLLPFWSSPYCHIINIVLSEFLTVHNMHCILNRYFWIINKELPKNTDLRTSFQDFSLSSIFWTLFWTIFWNKIFFLMWLL